MHVCEAAGVLDIGRFHALPPWQQDRWLAHVKNRFEGQYEPKRAKGGRQRGAVMNPPSDAELRAVEAFHAARRREAADG